ncbi:DUF4249 domain-containing protein [Hymenobacter seoulensis]
MHLFTRPLLWFLLLLLSSCVQEYLPEVIDAANNYLVVDGFINGNGTTTIQLARSVKLSEKSSYPAETNAAVFIENQAGRRYPLQEVKQGIYTSPSQELPSGQNYRVHIRTRQGRDYASDYVLLKQTPAIDQVEGRLQPDGVQIYLSAHDESNQTQYYRWRYEETWEFTSAYESRYRYIGNNTVVRRTDNVYNCWRTEISTAVTTTSTVRLSQDAVRDFRLTFIPSNAERFKSKYSILVRQYALSQEEFDYWEAVKKNTENIGTLFDPLPSQIQGNVYCLSDEQEPVLGFVGATTEVQKRIFIGRNSLPFEWRVRDEAYKHCTGLDTYPNADKYSGYTIDDIFGDSVYRVPVGRLAGSEGYTIQTLNCVDCRLRGSNVKPSFWP